jgi:hypothetical protein
MVRYMLQLLTSTWVCLAMIGIASAGENTTSQSGIVELDPATAMFFGLLDEGKIKVKLAPQRVRGSESINLLMTNATHEPHTIDLPPTLVATPILAQQQPVGAPQSLGMGMRAGQFPTGNELANFVNDVPEVDSSRVLGEYSFRLSRLLENKLFGPGLPGVRSRNKPPRFRSVFDRKPFLPNGTIQIAGGKTVKMELPTVCLNYGNPDPHPRYKYELRPLAEVIDSVALRRALWLNAHGHFNQAMTQAVAWHEANNLSWRELERINRTANGRQVPMFTAAELMVARRLVELPELAAVEIGRMRSRQFN